MPGFSIEEKDSHEILQLCIVQVLYECFIYTFYDYKTGTHQ